MNLIRRGALAFALALLQLCIVSAQISPPSKSASWPAADSLFRSDPRWLGGDAAFSADLGHGRVLWLFGDSFVASRTGATRRQSAFIRNSLAVQSGYDPSHASIRFYSGNHQGRPADFAPSVPGTWLWPLHAIRLDHHLLLFYMRMASDPRPHSLGFQSVGWNAFLVDNPDADPDRWNLHPLQGPVQSGKLLIGMSLLRDDSFLDAFILDDATHNAYLLRWPVAAAKAGDLSSPQWWCGPDRQWQPDDACRQSIIHDAGSELSVQRDPRGPGYLEVDTDGFGATNIILRSAPQPQGPWTAPALLFRPPESDTPDAFVYGAKSHPELSGADLVITYTANGSDERLATDRSIYFPRFVRVSLAPDPSHHP